MQWLSDNGTAYTDADTLSFAATLNLVLCVTPERSANRNGVSEAFVKTIKRDYAALRSDGLRATMHPHADSVEHLRIAVVSL